MKEEKTNETYITLNKIVNKVGSVRIIVTRSRNHCCHEGKANCVIMVFLKEVSCCQKCNKY
jgi:hypothetical protein